jgi:hypothetical protein
MATRDYVVRMPRDTLVRSACEDVECEGWREGWESHIDEGTVLGQAQADYIRRHSGRTFTELRSGPVTVFRFPGGQRCFAEHRTRPARLLVRQGHMIREHGTFTSIAEDYTEHAGRLAEMVQKG